MPVFGLLENRSVSIVLLLFPSCTPVYKINTLYCYFNFECVAEKNCLIVFIFCNMCFVRYLPEYVKLYYVMFLQYCQWGIMWTVITISEVSFCVCVVGAIFRNYHKHHKHNKILQIHWS